MSTGIIFSTADYSDIWIWKSLASTGLVEHLAMEPVEGTQKHHLTAVKNIFWNGYTHQDRNETISYLRTIANTYGAIIDIKKYSDLSMTFVLEVEGSQLANLYKALQDGIRLEPFDFTETGANIERTVFLNVTFGSGTGDLRIVVPTVPG
jgi:hypothetical protein